MEKSRHLILPMAALVAAIFIFASLASATAQSARRSGAGPCRQAALAIIAYLDRKQDNTAEYRHAYDGIVQTCGPVAPAAPSASSPFDREQCRTAALVVLDAIEENKINTKGFVQARNSFAQVCAAK